MSRQPSVIPVFRQQQPAPPTVSCTVSLAQPAVATRTRRLTNSGCLRRRVLPPFRPGEMPSTSAPQAQLSWPPA